jgi:hypothetical protein
VRHDRPTPAELLEAVREFLAGEILPLLDDHRLRFRTLVAMNALAIAQRQLDAGDRGLEEDELRDLAGRIRAGATKLRVSNPAYLDRYARSYEHRPSTDVPKRGDR